MAGAMRSGNSNRENRLAGGARNRRIDRSASDGCFSEVSSLVPTWISISGWSAMKLRKRGTKNSLAKNGCTEILTELCRPPFLYLATTAFN